jgi:hypothetical protein
MTQPVPVGLLLPLRIETRFRPDQLWLRVVPDEPWFTGHDPSVTDGELELLRLYREAGATPDAFRALVSAVGGPRAVYLVRHGDTAARSSEPALPRIAPFPDQLQVWLARGGGPPTQVATLTIDHDRLLADLPDPDDPDDRRWWEDFEEAVRIGLAARIDLSGAPADIDALYVTGLGTASAATHLADLRDEGRLGLLAPGTPTNSVDGAPAASLARDPETWQAVLAGGGNDTERQVSRALSGDEDLLGVIPGPDEPHRAWSSGLVAALWPALWGYAADDVWAVTAGRVDPLADSWAARAMFPEGPYPTVRIGSQPYGLLPATALTRWRPADGDPGLEGTVAAALVRMRQLWRAAAETRGTVVGASEEQVMDLVGALPTSSYFRHRLAWPLEMWWFATGITGGQATWPSFDERWQSNFSRIGEVQLNPARRYAARHGLARITMPLVEPPGKELAPTLAKLIDVAQQQPADFANVHQVENHDLEMEDSSLLIRLLIRSLQVAIGDVGRGLVRQPRALPELIIRPPQVPSRLETWITSVTPAALQAGTPATDRFFRVVAGIKAISEIPAARLATLLAATIDCAAYRIDPWAIAVPTRRLDDLLDAGRADVRIGAYGWVDAPRPGTPGPTPAGLVHAPSPSQALTAAVLRDRAVSDPTGTRWDLFLTSRSVRAADRLAEQVRVGAHLAEAVGREIERIVGSEADILRLRRLFPLRVEHAGRRTCDGLAVLAADPASLGLDGARITELDELRVALDAYGDLLVAEAVHHVTERRPDIAGAVMDAAAGLSRPPELSLLRTARSGRTLSTQVLLVLPDAAAPGADAGPAELADPATAAFLRQQLGPAAGWEFVADAGTVSLADLGLEPADALALPLDELVGLARAATGSTAPITGSGVDRYGQAARIVALVGRRPATAADLSELPDAPDDATAVLADLAARYGRVRDAAAQLVDRLRATPAADARLAWPWGIVADSPGAAADQLAARLAAAPDAAALPAMQVSAAAEALATLVSPTRQIAVSGRVSSLPSLPAAPAVDADWLPVVAAVREPLAGLDAHQLGGANPFAPFATKPDDVWQLDSADGRRLLVAYCAPGVTPAATGVAVTVLDRFTEVIPATEQRTGAAFGFDAPGSRAPQAVLLAVPPDLNEGLPDQTLVDIVAETRELARARMARPADLPEEFGTWLPTALLPATGSTAVSLGPVFRTGVFG